MAPPFKQLSLVEFESAVLSFPWSREKTKIHVHCTDTPDHARFHEVGGLQCVKDMYAFHTGPQLGWKDIAQHITIDPDGEIWTGRPWNWAPASASGYNSRRVFMFEMIGLFDAGKDRFEGAQAHSAHVATAAIIQRFNLDPEEAIVFHRDINWTGKTCPGSAISRDTFVDDVIEVRSNRFQARMFGQPVESRYGPSWIEPNDNAPNPVDELDSSDQQGDVIVNSELH